MPSECADTPDGKKTWAASAKLSLPAALGEPRTPIFESAIDQPAGRTDAIPSSATGKILRYFTPDPLTDLLDRAQMVEPFELDCSAAAATRFDAMALARDPADRLMDQA
jgi:hypothetical protein